MDPILALALGLIIAGGVHTVKSAVVRPVVTNYCRRREHPPLHWRRCHITPVSIVSIIMPWLGILLLIIIQTLLIIFFRKLAEKRKKKAWKNKQQMQQKKRFQQRNLQKCFSYVIVEVQMVRINPQHPSHFQSPEKGAPGTGSPAYEQDPGLRRWSFRSRDLCCDHLCAGSSWERLPDS